MATAYTPQPGAPPAFPKFEPSYVPEIIAFANLPGEPAPSIKGAPQVKFRLLNGRPWYAEISTADEIYRLGIVPRQQVEVVKFGRMKHEVRVTPLDAHSGLSQNGTGTAPPAPVPNSHYTSPQHNPPPPAPADPEGMRPAAACMASAMMAAVDAAIETQAYAQRKGLGVTFSEESIRCIGLSIYISACKGGAR
jgi:hypothetical protein